jgi:hypothetical protein
VLTESADHALVAADADPGLCRSPGWSTWLVLTGYLLAALVVTWRLWADPASRTVAGNPDDADLFAWYMRYAASSLAHGQLPSLVASALNAPSGINLMWNSSLLLPSILLAPVTLLFGAQVSLTVLTTLGFAGSAAAMFWVLRRWQVSDSAAALAGAVYGFSPALLQSALGHYDLQLAVLPPLIVDAMLWIAIGPPSGAAASRRPLTGWRQPVRTGIALGLLVTAEIFVSEELALTTVLTGTLLVAILATGFWRQARDRLTPTVVGAATAALVTAATAGWALWVQFFGPLTQAGTPFLRDFYVNDLTGFVTPSSFLLFHTSASAATAAAYRGQAPEYLAYLGWPLIIALAAAVVTFWLRPVIRAFAATAIILAVFSLGGDPLVSGVAHVTVDLPWHWIESLPLGGSVLPDRFSILLDGLAAVLLAQALDLTRRRLAEHFSQPGDRASRARMRTRTWTAAAGGVAVLACLPLVPLPLPSAPAASLPAGWTAAFAALHLPAGARVLVVPVPEVHLTEAMRWQADSSLRFSLIGGYFIGPAWDGHAYVDGNGLPPTAVYLNELWASGLRPGSTLADAAAGAGLAPPAESLATTQVHADLTTWHPQAVVAVAAPGSPLASYLITLFGKPAISTGGVTAWRTG